MLKNEDGLTEDDKSLLNYIKSIYSEEELKKLEIGADSNINTENDTGVESKSIWDYFLNSKEYISNEVSQGSAQLIDDAKNGLNNMAKYYIEAEMAQEQSDEIVRQGMADI